MTRILVIGSQSVKEYFQNMPGLTRLLKYLKNPNAHLSRNFIVDTTTIQGSSNTETEPF